MGLISGIFSLLFGGGRNVVRETAEVFRENADNAAERSVILRDQVMAQFGSEFQLDRKGAFDRFMDGLNRLPRPAMALGTLALLAAAMIDPLWFAARMQGIALVPEPLWWLLGVIVSFYFGARHQAKAQDFQRQIGATLLNAPTVLENLDALKRLSDAAEVSAELSTGDTDPNPALDDWKRKRESRAAT
ncbi:MAG: holin family protein [Ruegeria sp.]